MNKSSNNINEEINRIKSLFTEERMYGNLVENSYQEVIKEGVIKTGSDSDVVKPLQRLLGVEDDGVFGPKTKEALEKFQRENGLKDDGIAGEKTVKVLNKKFNIKEGSESVISEQDDQTAKDVETINKEVLGGESPIENDTTGNYNQSKYDDYNEKIKQTSTISDEVKRAEKKNEINNLLLSDLNADIKVIKGRMEKEEDPGKELEMLTTMNNIYSNINKIERKIDVNNEIINNPTSDIPKDNSEDGTGEPIKRITPKTVKTFDTDVEEITPKTVKTDITNTDNSEEKITTTDTETPKDDSEETVSDKLKDKKQKEVETKENVKTDFKGCKKIITDAIKLANDGNSMEDAYEDKSDDKRLEIEGCLGKYYNNFEKIGFMKKGKGVSLLKRLWDIKVKKDIDGGKMGEKYQIMVNNRSRGTIKKVGKNEYRLFSKPKETIFGRDKNFKDGYKEAVFNSLDLNPNDNDLIVAGIIQKGPIQWAKLLRRDV